MNALYHDHSRGIEMLPEKLCSTCLRWNIRLLTNDEVLHFENARDSDCSDGEISEPDLKYYLQVLQRIQLQILFET